MLTKYAITAVLTAALVAGSCGGSAKASGPSGIGNEFDGMEYTAEVVEIEASTTRRFAVIVTVRNKSDETKTKTYPAGCPVRVRLYRLIDQSLVYDETKIQCTLTTEASFTLAPGAVRTLQSGNRWPPDVVGDSLAATIYELRAAVLTEGETIVEASAGQYKIPDCQMTGGAIPSTVCT